MAAAARKVHRGFPHRRTVRLLVEDGMTVDSLSLIQSLPDFREDIVGVVPQYGGKCFDITLRTEESATRLATTGYDYENTKKPLRLLGRKTVHVSVFVSVEYPDEDLVTLLCSYGELKSNNLRRLHFTDEGFTHIERDLPRKIVVQGLEIFFKYSGQPVTCYRCNSTEHIVKDCPRQRRTQPSTIHPEAKTGGDNSPPTPAPSNTEETSTLENTTMEAETTTSKG